MPTHCAQHRLFQFKLLRHKERLTHLPPLGTLRRYAPQFWCAPPWCASSIGVAGLYHYPRQAASLLIVGAPSPAGAAHLSRPERTGFATPVGLVRLPVFIAHRYATANGTGRPAFGAGVPSGRGSVFPERQKSIRVAAQTDFNKKCKHSGLPHIHSRLVPELRPGRRFFRSAISTAAFVPA